MSQTQVHNVPKDTVVIAGGGPIGLLTATVLAFYGVKSILLERNLTTTRWPKMDLTNVRSMEFMHKLGLADGLRARGVPSHIPYDVIFTAGLSRDKVFSRWDLQSVDEYRRVIRDTNDGTQPREPYQRLSQSLFEAWMKELCDENPLIDLRFGWKLETVREEADGVEATVTELGSGAKHVFRSEYFVGCDGAGSHTRRSLEIPLDGGPVPFKFLLIHFKSKDLEKLHRQGRFWHLFVLLPNKWAGAAISQDEKDIFTVHMALAPDADTDAISNEQAVATVLGGQDGPYPIKIDEVLVRSTYRPSIAVARNFAGPHLRVFLAGDSAHQNIPTGGYGMNTGIGDAFTIGWKLAAVVNGQAAPAGMLGSYEQERRPVSITNVERSGVHAAVHTKAGEILAGQPADAVADETSAGAARVRALIDEHYRLHDGENTDLGIELGYRYQSSIIIPDVDDEKLAVPPWEPHRYIPTTVPGGRAPHVFLKDGSALFDLLGAGHSLVEFRGNNASAAAGQGEYARGAGLLMEAAATAGLPLKYVALQGEEHAAALWEKPLVLVRPDGHVAWRGTAVRGRPEAEKIVEIITGRRMSAEHARSSNEAPLKFTSTEESFSQVKDYELEGMGELQK